VMVIAGFDLGGTTTRIAVRVDGADTLRRFPTRVTSGSQLVTHLTRTLTATANTAGVDACDVNGVGIGMPGSIGPDRATVRLASNLGIGSEPLNLVSRLAEHLEAPVVVENDVKTAALGLVSTIPDPVDSILTYLSVGTGIASATVVNGTVIRGAHGSAGEIGQMQVESSGEVAPGSLPGSLEAMAAGPVMAGDPATAPERIEKATRYLAQGVHTLFMMFDPDHLVIGGGAIHQEYFARTLLAHLNELRSRSTVTASIMDPSRIRFLDVNATPGVDGALRLASKITQVSDRLVRSANDKGETP
jgi:predicted NBD/HSP70 family sugar kinase